MSEGSLARANVHGETPACRKIFAPTRKGQSRSFARYVRLRRGRPRRDLVVGRAGRLVLGRYAIRREVPGRYAVAAGAQRSRRLAGFGILVALIAARQPPVALGELGRQLDVRGRDRRRAPRPLPPSHRACTRATSPPVPRARSPAASRRPPMRSSPSRTCWCGTCFRPAWRRSAPIGFVATVSWGMAASLVVVAGLVVVVMFRRAAAGRPLHHEFANRAAAVDGEMTDVVGNMAIVKAFGGLLARASALRCQGRAGDGAPAGEACSTSSGCASCTRSSRWR